MWKSLACPITCAIAVGAGSYSTKETELLGPSALVGYDNPCIVAGYIRTAVDMMQSCNAALMITSYAGLYHVNNIHIPTYVLFISSQQPLCSQVAVVALLER